MVLAVVDASVAVKWVLPESQSATAMELIQGPLRLVAPEIIQMEVCGAVLRRFRGGVLEEDAARAACERWKRILQETQLHLVPLNETLELAFSLAFQLRHPLPDCLYLAAAKALRVKFITADRTLFERGRAVHPQTVLFGKAA